MDLDEPVPPIGKAKSKRNLNCNILHIREQICRTVRSLNCSILRIREQICQTVRRWYYSRWFSRARMIALLVIQLIAIGAWAKYAFLALFTGIAPLSPQTFYLLHPEGLGSLAAAGGVAGTLITWLLQHIRTEDCGVELGTVFRAAYPGYPWSLLLFSVSTAICLFLSNTDAIRSHPVYQIVLMNLFAMAAVLACLCEMCWNFLLSQNRRKQHIHRYLTRRIKSDWTRVKYITWNTIETGQLVTDFSVCAHWEKANPAWCFFDEWINRLEHMSGKEDEKEDEKEDKTLKTWLQETGDLFALISEKSQNYQADKILGCAIVAFSHNQNEAVMERITNVYRTFMLVWCTAIYSNVRDADSEDERILALFQCVFSATIHAIGLIVKRTGYPATALPEPYSTFFMDSINCCAAAARVATPGTEANKDSINAYFELYQAKYAQLNLNATIEYTKQDFTDPAKIVKEVIGRGKTIIKDCAHTKPAEQTRDAGDFGSGEEEPR